MGWPRESSVSALGSWVERDSLDGEAQAVFLAPFSLPVVGTGKGECAPKGDVPGCSSLVSGGVGLSPTWLWGPLCGGRSPGALLAQMRSMSWGKLGYCQHCPPPKSCWEQRGRMVKQCGW